MSTVTATVLVDCEHLAYAEVRENGDVFVVASDFLADDSGPLGHSRTLAPVRAYVGCHVIVSDEAIANDVLLWGHGRMLTYQRK